MLLFILRTLVVAGLVSVIYYYLLPFILKDAQKKKHVAFACLLAGIYYIAFDVISALIYLYMSYSSAYEGLVGFLYSSGVRPILMMYLYNACLLVVVGYSIKYKTFYTVIGFYVIEMLLNLAYGSITLLASTGS